MKNLFIVLFGLVIAGCSSQLAQKASQKAPATQTPTDASAIAVIPNPYVDDLTLANKAAEEAKEELIKRGYNIVANEADAKLIAVATVETNVVTFVKHASEQPIDFFSNSNLSQIDRLTVSNSLGSLGQMSYQGPQSSSGKGNDLLVIEAFSKDAWDHALIVNELQLQPAWKIRMPLPATLKPSIEGAKVAGTTGTEFVLPH